MTTPSVRVTFTGSLGTDLAGRLDLPAGPPMAYALFAHCFTCSKDLFAAGRIAAELNRVGIAVLRFDFTGLGASGGDFAETDFSSNLDDLLNAADWLRENHHAPQLLIGHSLGGAAVISVAADIPEVRAVATIGAPSDVSHILGLLAGSTDEIERTGRGVVDIGGRPFTIGRSFIEGLTRHSVEERAATLGRPLLVLHSPIDNVVGIENAARLFQAARHPKSFVAVDGADHLLTRRDDAEFAALTIGAWAQRYLDHEHPAQPLPAATAPVVVAESRQGPFLNQVVAGSHRFLADEPVSIGGFDAGPSPYDLLAAALGACTSMTLRMYADRKGLPLDRVIVEVTHAKVHAIDCAECVDEGPAAAAARSAALTMIDRFERRIILAGALDGAQREALLRIADRCPVHRTLERSSVIATTLAD